MDPRVMPGCIVAYDDPSVEVTERICRLVTAVRDGEIDWIYRDGAPWMATIVDWITFHRWATLSECNKAGRPDLYHEPERGWVDYIRRRT